MAEWRAIIMAGGSGSRLDPLTRSVNKHLLPVYDKPMIYFPLTTLMLGGLRDFIVVTSPQHADQIGALLGDGSKFGISIKIREQQKPGGIAECFRICRDDIAGFNVAVILGDNIFYGAGLTTLVQTGLANSTGATIFGYEVTDASGFGVVTLDEQGAPVALEEKPSNPASRLAVPGLYFYDRTVVEMAEHLQPSARGELEITDVNRAYLERGALKVVRMPRGIAWLDGGTPDALFEAAQFVHVLEERTGLRIACPEEVALRKGLISKETLLTQLAQYPAGKYRDYLRDLIASLE
jgi:glucose-1-phosphate thymidylyltransferase